jgi:hypothetical protein
VYDIDARKLFCVSIVWPRREREDAAPQLGGVYISKGVEKKGRGVFV